MEVDRDIYDTLFLYRLRFSYRLNYTMSDTNASPDDDTNSISSSDSGYSSLQFSVLLNAKLLRHEARQLHFKAKEISTQSQNEYGYGCKSKAKTLSIQANDLYEQRNEKNSRAAELVFNYFNQGRPDNVIDLHRLYVKEALQYLQQKLSKCRANNILLLEVITGEGYHSSDNVAIIKPEIVRFAHENHLIATVNIGHVMIDLAAKSSLKTTSHQKTNQCIIL
jgi:DNA-nicking Smr family endonuclease